MVWLSRSWQQQKRSENPDPHEEQSIPQQKSFWASCPQPQQSIAELAEAAAVDASANFAGEDLQL